MSANNQNLLIPYKNKYVVFLNVIAESWCDENMEHENEINLSAGKTFNTIKEAQKFINSLNDYTEYGTADYLIKDGAPVIIIVD